MVKRYIGFCKWDLKIGWFEFCGIEIEDVFVVVFVKEDFVVFDVGDGFVFGVFVEEDGVIVGVDDGFKVVDFELVDDVFGFVEGEDVDIDFVEDVELLFEIWEVVVLSRLWIEIVVMIGKML